MRSIIVSLACIAAALYLLHLASPSFALITGQASLSSSPSLARLFPLWPFLALIPIAFILALELLYRGPVPKIEPNGIGYKRPW